jgi:AraC family transcriptional regulator of adaptative response / DNA-3-methyladenine glycosylase II
MLARDARFDGRFFVAVTSTGIYCRPVCPARPPKAQNCIFMRSAAEAQEAGFRPCLRCRPEMAPGLPALRGTSNTTSRAISLIELGALDDGDVESLAGRVGVGGRHLRRLFMEHIGASPVAVAQARRVHIAKQLIHDTGMPMSEVALASGFGSVRRFNETFAGLFGRPPSSLRRGATGERGASAITLGLPYRPPFAWDEMLAFLRARAIPGVESVCGGAYARIIELGGTIGEVRVAHDAGRSRLQATIAFPVISEIPVIIARLRRMFDLDADVHVIGASLSGDPLLAPLVAERPGLRVPGSWDPFELAVRAIVGQQISVTAATRLIGRVAEEYGEPVSGAGPALERVFPSPAVLARAPIAGMPSSRASAINSLALSAAQDDGLFDRGSDVRDSIDRLCELPGLGPWTANYIAMRAMREPDAFPSGDIGLLRALDGGHGRPTPRELDERSQAWRPWRAYAALHLWSALGGERRSADTLPERELRVAIAA